MFRSVFKLGYGLRTSRILNPIKGFFRSFASSSGISSDTHGILPKLFSISRLANFNKLSFPQLVVVGNQSSGKSSVLDGLMGEDILPKGDSMVTRRPIEVSLVRDKFRWGRVDGGQEMSIPDMQKYIADENKDLDFTEVPLRIELHSPDVFNLNLIDLPGYVVSTKEGQDPELPSKIKELCSKYLRDDQNIILCVASASADIATSVAIGEAQRYDEDHDRTLGVLTKIDLGKSRSIRRVLGGEEYKLPLGWLGVRCRTWDELQTNMGFNELIQVESAMIKKKHLGDLRVGLPLLRRSLSDLLLHRVMQFFPELIERISSSIELKSRNSDLLDQLYKHRDLESIARKLEHLVTHFHEESTSRSQLEVACRKKLHEVCNAAIQSIENSMVDESQIQKEVVRIKESDYDSSGINHFTKRPYAAYRWKGSRSVYYNEESPRSNSSNAEIMNDLMIYGLSTPRHITNEKLRELSNNMLRSSVISRHFYPYVPEELHLEKTIWHRKLNKCVEKIVIGELPEKTRKEIIGTLISFVKSLSDPDDKDAELARFFFEYLIEQIDTRTEYQQVSEQISFMINRERRPQANYTDLANKIWEYLDDHHVRLFEKGWILTELYDYRFPVYGHIWTIGYFRILRERISDDIYRSYAINVINELVFENLHNSLKLFKSGRIFREAKKQMAEQKKLESVKNDLIKFQEGDFVPLTYQPVPVTVEGEVVADDGIEVNVTARRTKKKSKSRKLK